MDNINEDTPPFSRLFVIGDRKFSEATYTTAFEKFGEVQYVKLVTVRDTGESKGIAYIKFLKTSSAALAIENLHGVKLEGSPRPLKVLVASSKGESQLSDEDILQTITRLFVMVPKVDTEADIARYFEQFGDIQWVKLLRDKASNDSKGLAYVRFRKASHAARAYEECDSSYKAKFADPVRNVVKKRQHEEADLPFDMGRLRSSAYDMMGPGGDYQPQHAAVTPAARGAGPRDFLSNFPHEGKTRLVVKVRSDVTQLQLTKLFSIVPTLEYCDLHLGTDTTPSTAYVKYSAPECCAYARESINGLEYPPGCPLSADFYSPGGHSQGHSSGDSSRRAAPPPTVERYSSNENQPDVQILQSLFRSIQQASTVLQSAGVSTNNLTNVPINDYTSSSASYPDLDLPPVQPRAPKGSEMVKRLFFVTQSARLPDGIVKDVFSRFGDFIDAHYIAEKNCGFVMYASDEGAEAAKAGLHLKVIRGILLKVLDAQEPRNSLHKKSRMMDSDS